jgi:phage terminase large subunit-like protein
MDKAARLAEIAAEIARMKRDRLAALDKEREEIRARHPLAYARLWVPVCRDCGGAMDCPESLAPQHVCRDCGASQARTCQRCAIHAVLVPGVRVGFVLGGNRTGKSEGAAQLDAAYAMGGAHPDVIEWLAANGLPTTRIPKRPGLVVPTALTSGDSRAYVRPKVAKYLPPDWKWLNEHGNGVAICYSPDASPNAAGGVLHFKSVDQGRRGHQGTEVDLYRFDEEPDDYAVVKEARRGLIDRKGLAIFSMTPLRGWTKLLRQFAESPDDDVVVRYLSALDNPYIDPAEVRAILRKASPAEKAARIEGKIAPLEGTVHSDFRRDLHVVKAFDPPADWLRFGGIDFGTRDPFVHLWFALDRSDDVLHVYREHYQPDATLRTHSAEIWHAESCPACMPDPFTDPWWDWRIQSGDGGTIVDGAPCGECAGTGRREPEILVRWADPANLDSRMTLAGEYDLATTPANKDRRTTFEALFDRLSLDAEGRPHIVIHDCCTETIREIENLTWNEKRAGELETKGTDHAHDVLRYVCRGLQLAGYTADHTEDE